MSDVITQLELDGLRRDFDEMLGDMLGTAKTTVAITRVTSSGLGAIDPVTLQYSSASTTVIFTGPAYISPIVFRRDRQEFVGGGEARIRQYRAIIPWDSGDIHVGDALLVVTSSDPQFVNKTLDIIDVMYESELAARRITMVDSSSSGEDCP